MTIRKYEREYRNPTGPSTNVPVKHDYDQTKPRQDKPVPDRSEQEAT